MKYDLNDEAHDIYRGVENQVLDIVLSEIQDKCEELGIEDGSDEHKELQKEAFDVLRENI